MTPRDKTHARVKGSLRSQRAALQLKIRLSAPKAKGKVFEKDGGRCAEENPDSTRTCVNGGLRLLPSTALQAGCSPLFALKISVEGWQRNTGGKAVGVPSWSLQTHQNCRRNRKIVSPAHNEGARRSAYAGRRPEGRSLLHKTPHCPDQTRAPSRQWQKNGRCQTSCRGSTYLDSPVRADSAHNLDKLGLVISCGC